MTGVWWGLEGWRCWMKKQLDLVIVGGIASQARNRLQVPSLQKWHGGIVVQR